MFSFLSQELLRQQHSDARPSRHSRIGRAIGVTAHDGSTPDAQLLPRRHHQGAQALYALGCTCTHAGPKEAPPKGPDDMVIGSSERAARRELFTFFS